MAKKYLLPLFNLLMLLSLLSCGKPADQKRDDAVLSANIMLSTRQCQAAIDLLEGVGRDTYDGKYMQTLASAYACKAGFTEPRFFVDELPKVGTPGGLGGLTRFTLASTMTAPDAESFENLQKAIDILLYAGGVPSTRKPTASRRVTGLSSADAQDINAQLMYLVLTQMGLYLHYYGDSSESGVKGSGVGTNTCLVNYDKDVALNVGGSLDAYFATNVTGACKQAGLGTTGHPQLGADKDNLNVARLCQGVVLLNTFIDVFPAVLASITTDDLDTVNGITTAVNLAKTAVTTAKTGASMATLMNTLNQANCVANNTANTEYLQVYFAFMYEALFQ